MAIVLSGTTGIDAGSLPVNNCGNTEVEGNLNLSGVGTRITGDFSNGTYSNRVAFQSSISNGNTIVSVIPNGTGTSGSLDVYNSSSMDIKTQIGCNSSESFIRASQNSGTGTFTPMTFHTGGTERMRIDSAGNVGIGTSSPAYKVDIVNASGGNMVNATYTGGTKNPYIRLAVNSDTLSELAAGNSDNTCSLGIKVNGTERMRIDTVGNVLVTSSTGGLGYRTGAGGSVTQLTSKTTGVTLNKPSGDIIMSNSALAAGASASFGLYNSLISLTDTVTVSLVGGASNGDAYRTEVRQITPGQIAVRVVNISGGSLSEALVIHFNIHRGANA